MNYKKIQLTFNINNKMQAELYEKCMDEFGSNLSGGIKSILTLYFNGSIKEKDHKQIQQTNPKQTKIDNDSIFTSVL